MSSFLLDDTLSDWEMTKTCQKFDVGLAFTGKPKRE